MEHYRHAESMLSIDLINNAKRLCSIKNNIAVILRRRAEYDKAENLIMEAIAIQKEAQGDNFRSPMLEINEMDWGGSLVNLTYLYKTTGMYKKAEETLLNRYDLYSKLCPHRHLIFIGMHRDLGEIYTSMKEYQAAKDNLHIALELSDDIYGRDHVLSILILCALGELYLETSEHEMAELYLTKALGISDLFNESARYNHMIVSLSLAKLYIATQKYSESKQILMRTLELAEGAYSKEHPIYVRGQELLQLLNNSRHEPEKAT
jgi:tetratricopeptide (TPR) repeat protein